MQAGTPRKSVPGIGVANPAVANRLLAVAGLGLVALLCGCDSKTGTAGSGSSTIQANAATTSSQPAGRATPPPGVAPLATSGPLSTLFLAPPMPAPPMSTPTFEPGRADLLVLEASPAEIEAVKQEARKLNDAFYAGDFASVVRLRHPRFIEKIGGTDLAIEQMRQQLARTVQRGVKVESFEIFAEPIFVKSTIREYVFVPTKRIVGDGTNRIERFGFEFGSREIGNPTWTYVDGAQLNASNINSLFPDFPADRRLPDVLDRKIETEAAGSTATPSP
jgi:hypothetical protein